MCMYICVYMMYDDNTRFDHPIIVSQGKWSMNDFHRVKSVRICTVCTPYARCKSLRKSVVIPCKSVVIPWYHYGGTRTYADFCNVRTVCAWCKYGLF